MVGWANRRCSGSPNAADADRQDRDTNRTNMRAESPRDNPRRVGATKTPTCHGGGQRANLRRSAVLRQLDRQHKQISFQPRPEKESAHEQPRQ